MTRTVFVYEFCSCQRHNAGDTTEALRGEGLAMLSAIMEDFGRVAGVEPVALVAEDLHNLSFPHCRSRPRRERRLVHQLAREADFSLVIAPEMAGLLEERCRWVIEAGGRLLGPAPEAIHLTSDKFALAEHLLAHRIPTPAAYPAPQGLPSSPAVCKPRHGAGSLHTYLVHKPAEARRICQSHPDVEFILQDYHRGTAVSVAFLMGPGVCLSLMPCRQNIAINDGVMSYEGGRTPLEEPLRRRARQLARLAVESVPGLLGYVGVDLILGERDVVIEINPRLTTSYLGLRWLARRNLAAALLAVVQGRRPSIRWDREHNFSWETDGTIHAP